MSTTDAPGPTLISHPHQATCAGQPLRAGWPDSSTAWLRGLPVPARWPLLTSSPGKARAFARDLWLGESWSTLTAVFGAAGAYRFAWGVGLVWLRPDAFAAGVGRRVLNAIVTGGFRPVATCPVRLGRGDARGLWAYTARCAPPEGLCFLDAVVRLGPGLLLLCVQDHADDYRARRPGVDARTVGGGTTVAARLTDLKGGNDPASRPVGCLRQVAGSPNAALTMLHSADEPADVVRELGVLVDAPTRTQLVTEAATRWRDGRVCPVEDALRRVEAMLPAMPANPPPGMSVAGGVADAHQLLTGPLQQRWAALCLAARTWQLAPPGGMPVDPWADAPQNESPRHEERQL